MRTKRYIVVFLLLLWSNISLSYAAEGKKTLGLSEAAIQIRDELSIRNIRKDLARLSSLESRVTGYPQAANGSKYIFDRFVEMGLQNVESREFSVTVPIDHNDSGVDVISADGSILHSFPLRPLWPNLVRTSLLTDGIKHTVETGETLEEIANNYAVPLTEIQQNTHNQHLPTPVVEGNVVFIPTGGLTGELIYAGNSQLADFNGRNVGGFWYPLQEGDTLVSLARRFRVTQASITDDVLNGHLQKASDGIDNDEDGIVDEYGEIPLLSEILGWATDGIDNNADGWTDEVPGDDTDGIDNNKDGQIDEPDEFIAASESHLFIPKGAIILTDFNSGTRWINAAMLGASAVIFIEPETTIRGEAENKFLTVPANIPRFWLSKEDANEIKNLLDTGEQVNVQLHGKMSWERRVGQNIRGFLEGGDPVLRDELVVLTAYYDSMSVVPALSPGADPTCGIAVLMEIARLFSLPQYRPGRSVLFVAVDAHFQGLAGMRAFMEGIGQDIVGTTTDSPGTPTLHGLRRGLSTDIIEFEELGRKLLLSIDRSILVDLDATFYHGLHGIREDLESLETTLEGLSTTRSQIDSLHTAQRDFSERQKKQADRSRKREKQGFTEEEKSRLNANLVRFEKEALQTTHFLRDIVNRLGQIRKDALNTSRDAQRELIDSIALPTARLDIWAIDKLIKELESDKIGDSYGTHPNTSYLLPVKSGSDYSIPTPNDLPTELVADIELLNNTLANWEMSDQRKFALMWTPDKILDRHLDLPSLKDARKARKVLANTDESLENAISRERTFLEKISNNLRDSDAIEQEIKNAITRLRDDQEYNLTTEIQEQYLTDTSKDRIETVNAQLRQRLTEAEAATETDGFDDSSATILIEDLTRDKQGVFEIALRNARLEASRIQNLLDSHQDLTREYLDEELIILNGYLTKEEVEQTKEARKHIAAYLVEAQILESVKNTAASDIISLENLIIQLPSITRDLDAHTKVLLRDNMLTLRNARFRNIQSRVEKMSRISDIEYNKKLEQIEAAVALQDLFNRYYTSLFCSIDLSSQSSQFGVFNKGWFYDQEPEFVLRREFASIGNKLAAYAADADFGVRVRKLWQATDDQIRQAVMERQWSVASQISDKEALEGKTLETLLSAHYGKLTGLGGVSRLMKMQFEQWRNRGEPSEDMLKDMDYIRKEVERFIRNDVRSAKKNRKNSIRMREQLDAMLRLRNEDPDAFTEDEIEDIKTLISIVGLGGDTNFVNAISASGGKTWKTYIPGKIAFDSEVATLVGKTGIAFATIEDARVLTDTPLDTIDRVDLNEDGNLHQQAQTLASLLIQALRDPQMPTAARVGNFYCNLFGDVVEFDARESALPNKPVPYPILTLRRKHKSMMGVRGDLFVMGDNKGNFEVAGLAMEGRATRRLGGVQEVEAYILDPDSGDIVYAPDLGNYGAKLLPNKVSINTRRRGCRVVTFPCVSTTIYDLVDQRYLRTLRELEVYDALSDSPPEKFGVSKPWQQEGVSAAEPIALVYSEPETRIKIGMAYGQIGKRLLLIKATKSGMKNPTLYTGEGFVVRENGSIRLTPYVVVRDMWWLDENRSRLYKRFGISSDRLDKLHQFANEYLTRAETALFQNDYQQALKLARAAWGYESRAYPDVKRTGNDVVNGIMFYLALLMPFAYFMERLIFGFPNINKQILGTFGIFLVVFYFLSQVHPAFQITTTPIIILIAFVVLALTVIVISIIVRKFEEQLEKIRQQGNKVYKADVGRLSASAAAFSLGISNMRKRKGRTILTCATLVILTFTVISFTSVRTFMHPNRTSLPQVTPRYTGLLIRDQYWRPLEEPVLNSILNDMQKTQITVNDLERLLNQKNQLLAKQGQTEIDIPAAIAQLEQSGMIVNVDEERILAVKNVVSPRSWYQSSGTGDQSFVQLTRSANSEDTSPPTHPLTGEDLRFAANMLVGMSEAEPSVTGIDRYLQYGKWFDREDAGNWPTDWPYAIVLPKGMADLLKITESDMGKATISVYGADFTVVGVLGIGFKDLTDNDGEELTPVDYQLMQQQQSRGGTGDETLEGELQKYLHLTPDSIAILPYEVVMNQGGTLRSVAVNMEPQEDDPALLGAIDKLDLIMAPLMNRIALDFFVGRDKDTYLYSSIGMTSFSGMGNLFVPILIAALIVLNTMLGAVYERVREISIYSSVGLAPIHIAFLFLAEACVYAIVGAVLGYLMGQVIATTLVHFGWLAGLTLNYSSMSTVVATVIVMIVVLLSTLYPAIKASRMAVPDIERKWKLPEPEGDVWHFNLPFTVLAEEALGLNVFMRDYFDAHADESASDFYTDNVGFKTVEEEDLYTIGMMVWLAPYDLGVSQSIQFITSPVGGEEEDLYKITLEVNRESGEIASWKRVNRRFLNLLRKQLLIWRTFSVDTRAEFHERGRTESANTPEASPQLDPVPTTAD
ncbi:LysM peptidoglycan-binding domain-containing protein [Candidatus Poribacteria bacterium]|nr:LysM peptidoglycan-binding domain-containing protein [Candidatus Poribacteria bacterium]